LRWGMGKIDAYQAVVNALGLVGMEEREVPRASVWPNPATQALAIMASGSGVARIAIHDPAGRTVSSSVHGGGGPIEVDVAGLPAGVYVVRLEQSGEVSIARFVKQ
jgi:hypothetical protein